MNLTNAVLFAFGVLLLLLCIFAISFSKNRVIKFIIGMAFIPFCGLCFILNIYISLHYFKRSLEENTSLAPGVVFERVNFETNNSRSYIHIITADLDRVELDVTHPSVQKDGKLFFPAMITSKALKISDANIAINASFFAPFREKHLFDYYPHAGDLVQSIGNTYSKQLMYGIPVKTWPKLLQKHSGELLLVEADIAELDLDNYRFMLSGKSILIRDGAIKKELESRLYPRTVVGWSNDSKRVFFVIVDGKQPGYSDGISLQTLANYLTSLGVDNAIELDGGGSATLAWKSFNKVRVLNRPIHTKIPGRERPVANHLLMYFK